MSIIIDGCLAAPAALPRERALVTGGARRGANDAQPRFLNEPVMPAALMGGMWRPGSGMDRGFGTLAGQAAIQHRTQDGRVASFGATYVATTKHSIRSGPPTDRPPA